MTSQLNALPPIRGIESELVKPNWRHGLWLNAFTTHGCSTKKKGVFIALKTSIVVKKIILFSIHIPISMLARTITL